MSHRVHSPGRPSLRRSGELEDFGYGATLAAIAVAALAQFAALLAPGAVEAANWLTSCQPVLTTARSAIAAIAREAA